MKTAYLLLLVSLAGASAKDLPFAPVAEGVKTRTGHTVQWERELEAREESRTRVRALLQKPLTLTGVVQLALLNNRGLQATFEEVGLSYAELRSARLLPNPEAELAVKFPDRPPTNPLYEWSVAQSFLSLAMLPLRTKVAREQLAAAQMRVTDGVLKLVAEVKVGYYELLAAQQIVLRLEKALESQAASLQLMQQLHEAGNVTDLALVQEQAQYSQMRLEIATAQTEARAKRERMNRLLGTWGAETEWRLASRDLPPVPPGEISVKHLETLAVGHRLDLAAARAELESAAHALGLQKRFRFIGALDFGIEGESEPDGVKLTGPSVRLELPIFHQGQARVARSEAQFRLAAAKFEQLAVELRSEVRELRDCMLNKGEMARFYQVELVPLRRRATELTLHQYNAMLTGAFAAFAARREDIAAERGSVEAVRDYWVARAELERAVGGDLTGQTKARTTK